jgi:hypothetical protein
MKTDGTEKDSIIDDYARVLNVDSGWIYYTNGENEWNIYKIRIDGTKREQLNNDKSYSINIVGDWIYYRVSTSERQPFIRADDELFRIRTDGTGREKVS